MVNELIADVQKIKTTGKTRLKRTTQKKVTVNKKSVYELTIDQPMLSYALESYLSQFSFIGDNDRIVLGSLPSKFTIKVERVKG